MRRRLLRVFAACVLLVILVAPLFIAFTSGGARLVLSLLEDRLPVSIGEVEGTLWKGIRISELSYEDSALRVAASDIDLRIDWPCAMRSELCIDLLTIEQLTLRLDEAPADDAPLALHRLPLPDPPLPWTPLPLRATSVRAGSIDIYRGEQRFEVRELQLAFAADRERLEISQLAGRHAAVAWDGSLGLGRDGQWQLAFDLESGEAFPALEGVSLPERYSLRGSGDLSAIQTELSSLESDTAAAVSLALEITRERAEPELVVDATLQGAAQLLPALKDNPWTQLQGPLSARVRINDVGTRVQLRQALLGYTPRAETLHVQVLEQDGLWRLTRAYLGEVSSPRLSVSGMLGSLDALRPELDIRLREFAPPGDAVPQLNSLSGDVVASIDTRDLARTWALSTAALSLDTSVGQWVLASDLQASRERWLPAGNASLRGESLAVNYSRDSTADAPALLDLPGGLELDDLAIDTFEASLTPGATERLQLRLAGDIDATLTAELETDAQGIAFTIEPFAASLRGQTATLEDAVAGRWTQSRRSIEVQPFCIGWRSNRACVEPATLGESGSLAARLTVRENLRRELDGKPYGLRAAGDGSLVVAWDSADTLTATLELDLSELSIDPFVAQGTAAPVSWETAQISASFDRAEGIEVAARMQSSTAGSLVLGLRERAQALSGELRLDGLDLSALDDLSPEWTLSSGLVDADLRLSGSRDAPRLDGSMDLRDGEVRIRAIDSAVTDARMQIIAAGETIRLDGDAMLGGGSLRLAGRCCDEESLALSIAGERNRLRLYDGLDVEVSPDLELMLTPTRLRLDGELLVHEGVLEHSGPREGGISLSDDIVRVDRAAERPRRFDLQVNIRTLIEPGFTLRSEELEATLTGDLRANAESGQPAQLFGTLQVLGGELRAYGQVLRLTEGSVGFVGDPLNPQLDLSAERRIRAEDLRVGFRVSGSLEEPLFELFSDPVRSERDTLSYLLRGRGPDAGASIDSTALALSLGTSALNRAGVLSSLNRIPGLSDVTLGAEGSEEDMAATLSAYVGERLYLSYGVGIYEPVNALTARLYLRSRLWLEVVSRLENSFDLYYRFDRD